MYEALPVDDPQVRQPDITRARRPRLGARDRARRGPSPHAGVARQGPRACVARPRRSPQPRSASRSSSLPPRAARIRCASGSSTTGSSSTAARPRLPTARPDRCPAPARQPLVGRPRDPGLDQQAEAPGRPERPRLQLGHLRPHGEVRDRERDRARVLDPGHPALGQSCQRLERRSDRRSRPSSLRGRRAEALQRHLPERRRRHPSPREPLDGMERAEQPCFPQAAVPPIGRAGRSSRAATTRRSATPSCRESSPSSARRRSRAAPPAAWQQQPELQSSVRLTAALPSCDEGGWRTRVRRLRAPSVLPIARGDAVDQTAAGTARGRRRPRSRSGTSTS